MSHDLTFVAPERRDEVRRRIAAVEDFIATPGRAAAEEAASKLGLRTAQFYNLVRAWRAAKRPEAIMGRNAPRNMRPRIDGRVLDVIDRIVAESGRASAGDLVERVNIEMAARGLPPPDSGTVARHVRSKRPSLLTDEMRTEYDLIIDHTVVDLPVDFGTVAPRRPLVTLAIDVAADAIVGLALSSAAPRPAVTAAALLDAMRRGTRNGPVRTMPTIGIVTNARAEVDTVIDVLVRHGIAAIRRGTHAHGGGLAIEAILGREHAGLRLKQRLVWNEGRRLAKVSFGAKALDPEEAETMVRGRLLDGRAITVFAGLDDASRKRLADDLSAFAQSG